MSVLGTSALAAALAIASPMAAPLDVHPAEVEASAHEVVVKLGPYPIAGFWGSASIPLQYCPAEAPYLNDHEYHPQSGWIIPRGVSIDSRGALVQASIGAIGLGDLVGINGGSVVSWSTATDVTVRLHCTDRR